MNKLLSLLLLLLLSPIFIIISFIIFLDDGFPILFKQTRIGKNNNKFSIYKFRTMKNGTPDIPTHLVNDTSNIYTNTGILLRKFSFDELPQLINIFKGEMVFIGPRPALHNQEDLIRLRKNLNIHFLKPGVTGWAQVNGRDHLSIKKKVEMDFYYKNNKSLLLNCKILIFTMKKLFISNDVKV
jgi:O-antigen biosynthesis protein WbqP